jgi:hypothetical protein
MSARVSNGVATLTKPQVVRTSPLRVSTRSYVARSMKRAPYPNTMLLTGEQRAQMVDGIWATITPGPLTPDEAIRAFRKLYRFAATRWFPHGAEPTSYPNPVVINNKCDTWEYDIDYGKDGSTVHPGKEFRININKGWPKFVTSVAEYCGATDQNDIELRMVKEILKRGWLDGRLQDTLIPPEERKAQARAKKLESIERRIVSWEKKQKRATNALKKLRVQHKRMVKAAAGQ